MEGLMKSKDYLWIVVFLTMSLGSPETFPQVFKWVDEQGKVHFGDKPTNKDEPEEVSIDQAYKPLEKSAEELTEIKRQQKIRMEERKLRREQSATAFREKKKKRAASNKKKRERIKSECDSYKRLYQDLTTMPGPASPNFYYLKENGKAVSEQRQKEYIKDLKKKIESKKCQKYM
jgi:hypothetical protein